MIAFESTSTMSLVSFVLVCIKCFDEPDSTVVVMFGMRKRALASPEGTSNLFAVGCLGRYGSRYDQERDIGAKERRIDEASPTAPPYLGSQLSTF